MVKDDCTTTYAVDLSREEYVRSQELVSRRARGARWLSPALLLICVLMTVSNAAKSGIWDISVFSLLALLIIAEVCMMVFLPKQVRRRHEAAYNTTVFRGYDFKGRVTVEHDAIRKQTRTATAVIPFSQCRLFVEAPDMMIFFGTDGKGIVIPSRFLTEETALATRQAAMDAIPLSNRMMLAPLIPKATEDAPTLPTDTSANEESLMTVDITYTDREMIGIAVENTLQQFWDTLPNKLLWMTMVATIGFFMLYLPPLPLFLAGLLILFLSSVLAAVVKIKRAMSRTEGAIASIRMEFTEKEVLLVSKNGTEGTLHFPWPFITRAVDCGDRVEMYVDRIQQLLIPKRCVEDFEEFKNLVDRCREKV